MSPPVLSVIVASHDRPLRLRWLLNALEGQTLDRSLWEVVVGHDSAGEETERLLNSHPLSGSGNLRWVRQLAGSAPPGANRNAAIRLARAPTLVFTDDDCRPPPGWLASVADAAREHPGCIIQGPVQPDPDEAAMLRSAHPRSQEFSRVPRPWAECCNMVYPKELIEALGGFAEDVLTGEDAELNQTARANGAPYIGEPRMLTFHAVEEGSALDVARDVWRWGDLARLIKRHPALRHEMTLRVFWKPSHPAALVAATGACLSRHRSVRLAALLLWSSQHRSARTGLRARVRDVLELPGWAVIDLAEITALARGSLRHGALLL